MGQAVRWKVCLVSKGFEQIYGKDYTKTTSPTARMESWRILLHMVASLGWDAQQINVKMAFLYGLLPNNTCSNPLVLRNQERKTGYGNCNAAYMA
jgi:hypothetical protein